MSKNDSLLGNSLLASTYISPCWFPLGCCSHNLFFIIGLKQFLPNLRLFRSLMPYRYTGTSRKILYRFIGLSSINFLKSAVGFGIGFLKQNNPKFLFISPGKGHIPAGSIYHNISIQLINPPLAINTQPDQKVPTLQIIILKQPLNQIGILGQTRQSGQKITIPQSTLLYVIRFNSALKQLWFAENLGVVFP
jgi:hypothetical protein